MKNITMLTKTDLETRWSKALIKKFAPTIAKQKKNIYGGTTFLYLLEEIEKIEQNETFKREYVKTMNRKAKAKERSIEVEKKLMNKKIAQFIDSLIVKLPTKEKLIDEAIYHYNQITRNGYCADRNCDKDFLLRIAQNYVRHICSNYEDILFCYSNGKYKNEAYYALKEHINGKVETLLAS